MTNQENLQQHNNELSGIKILLDKKTIAINNTTKVFEMELPEEFSQCTNIYTFEVDSNTVLISGDTTNIGIWSYKINTNTIEQIYNEQTKWLNFYVISKNKILITNEGTGGILLFDITSNSISKKHTNSGILYIEQVNENKYLLGGKWGGLLLLNLLDESISTIYKPPVTQSPDPAAELRYFKNLGSFCLISGYNRGCGILIYIEETNQVYKAYNLSSSNRGFNYFTIVGNRCLMSSAYESGILMCDINTRAISKIYTSGQSYNVSLVINNMCFLASNQPQKGDGLLLFKDDSISKIYSISGTIEKLIKFKNKILATLTSSILLYNLDDESTKMISIPGNYYKNTYDINDKLLMTPGNTIYSNLYILDYNTDEFKILNINCSFYDIFLRHNNKCYLKSSTKPIIFDYNSEDDSIKVVGYKMEVSR